MSQITATTAAIDDASLFQSSISLIGSANDDNGDGNGDEGRPLIDENVILARLNELRMWQQSQQQLLINDQVSERERLQREKLKLYELFGLSITSEPEETDETIDNDDDKDEANEERYVHRTNDKPSMNEQQIICSPPSKLNLNKIVENMAIRSKTNADASSAPMTSENIVKRPYLKRGEGLTNRFKIAPDAFRLDNLPKYKFARRRSSAHVHQHPKHSRHQQQQQQQPEQRQSNGTRASSAAITTTQRHQTTTTTAAAAAAAAAPPPPPGEGQQNNVKRNQIFHVNQSGALKLKAKPRKNCVSHEDEPHQQKHRMTDENNTNSVLPSPATHGEVRNLLTPSTKPLFATPIRNRLQCQQNEINELALFERLEENLAKNSTRATTTTSTRTTTTTTTMDGAAERKDDLLLQFNLGLHLGSNRGDEKNESFVSSGSSNGEPTDESKHVHFAVDATNIENNNLNNNNNNNSNSNAVLNSGRVVPVEQSPNPTIPHTSSPNERSTESFKKFKEKLFDRKLKQKFQTHLSLAKNFDYADEFNSDDNASVLSAIEKSVCGSVHSDTSAGTATHSELKDQHDELQDRLLTLESEIRSFREQNIELTKAIREHELIRMAFDTECRTAQEQLEEERVRFEMYMHDEQAKLLNERQDLDRRAKELQRPTRTERDEIMKLREQCANHDKELANREQKHVAAQARMRAQLRTIEKDFKELQFEVENLRRENKKLETENVRMRRQSNTKMLHEINKNIAKLAPPVPSATTTSTASSQSHQQVVPAARSCSNRNAHKTVVAKVTMHRGNESRHRIRSKSVPNLQRSEKVSHSTGTSPNTSEAENGFSDEDECVDHNVGYFGVNAQTSKQSTRNDAAGAAAAKADSSINNTSSSCGSNSTNSLKRIIENPDGSKDIWYPNGNLKKVSADSMLVRMLYYNKDIKETNVTEGTIKYYYAETNTWHTTYTNGLEILEFPNGQTEHRHKDGTVEVHFPNGSVRTTCPAKERNEGISEEWTFADGTNVIQKTNGERLLLLPNGQREVHTRGHKRREYPDGTVKIVYPDGSQESRYANGRVRLKDKDGKLIMDSETIEV